MNENLFRTSRVHLETFERNIGKRALHRIYVCFHLDALPTCWMMRVGWQRTASWSKHSAGMVLNDFLDETCWLSAQSLDEIAANYSKCSNLCKFNKLASTSSSSCDCFAFETRFARRCFPSLPLTLHHPSLGDSMRCRRKEKVFRCRLPQLPFVARRVRLCREKLFVRCRRRVNEYFYCAVN